MRKFVETVKKIHQLKTSTARNSSYLGLWSYNLKDDEFTFEDEFIFLLGYGPESSGRMPLAELCSPEYIRRFSTNVLQSLNEKTILRTEIQLLKKDGKPFWIYLTGGADEGFFGHGRKISGVLLDINRLKETEEEIQKKNEELEALYEEAEAQNEELAAMMDELSENQIIIEESNIKLQISEYKYRNIFEKAPFGIIQFTHKGEILNINDKFRTIFELPEKFEDQVNQDVLNNFFENISVAESILSLTETDRILSFSNENALSIHKKIIPVNVQALCTRDSFTGEKLFTIFIEDISKLKSSQFERDLLFNNSADMLMISDLDGNIKQINPAWTKILKWSQEEIFEMGPYEITCPEDAHDSMKFYRSIPDSKVPITHVNRMKTRSGDIRTISWTGIGYRDLELIFLTGRDETERFKAERELKKMWDRLDIATKNGVIGLWDFDLQSNMMTLNRSMSELLGFESSLIENPEKNWFGRIHREDIGKINRATEMHLNGESEYYMTEYRFSLPDGSYRWMLSRGKISERDKNNKPIRISGSITDITDQKNTEENKLKIEKKMQQAQKLESLGILAGGIAHDFNNILQGILGNADLLIDLLPSNSKFLDELYEIKKSAMRATELTGQMLAYSGRGTFIFKPIKIDELIRQMESLIGVSVSKKAEIIFSLEEDIPPFAGDITQIKQILMNIISNSSDSLMDKPGKILITAGRYKMAPEDIERLKAEYEILEGDYVYISVSDNGSGISDENISRIFDPFFSTKFAGRGLGLAAVQGIVKSHNGALEVTSREGAGTEFKLFMPVTTQPEMEEITGLPSRSGTMINNGSSTILVADDEKHIRDLAVKILNLAGYKTITASDGREAVNLFKEKKDEISAIIMDMTMPELDGDEAIAEIMKVSAHVPIIISSGYSEVDIAGRFSELESIVFLHKPYQVDDLIGALERALT